MTTPKIDADFVTEWAAAYPSTADYHVLGSIHRAVGERGYFTHPEAEDVIRWKSNRSITFLRKNDPADVETITEMALFAALGHVITHVREEISSRMPTRQKAQRMTIPDGVPVIELWHTGIDADREPFEATRFVMRADSSALDYDMPVEDK